jgi:hypothetical protein
MDYFQNVKFLMIVAKTESAQWDRNCTVLAARFNWVVFLSLFIWEKERKNKFPKRRVVQILY